MKKCSECQVYKETDEFYKNKSKEDGLSSECKDCIKQSRKKKYDANPEQERERSKINRKRDPQYYTEKTRKWRANNPDRVKENRNEYQKSKWQNDPTYKLRQTLSKLINQGLKSNGSSKKGDSCSKYLSYSFQELKEHLEKQFEPWMNWGNWGKYDPKTWDDSNPLTWTWQIDHVIPQSVFLYVTMNSQCFQDCWALSNLRPLSAKQNLLDGVSKVRH